MSGVSLHLRGESINRLTEERGLVLIELLLKTRKVLHRRKCQSYSSELCLNYRGEEESPEPIDHMPRLNLSELTPHAGALSMSTAQSYCGFTIWISTTQVIQMTDIVILYTGVYIIGYFTDSILFIHFPRTSAS